MMLDLAKREISTTSTMSKAATSPSLSVLNLDDKPSNSSPKATPFSLVIETKKAIVPSNFYADSFKTVVRKKKFYHVSVYKNPDMYTIFGLAVYGVLGDDKEGWRVTDVNLEAVNRQNMSVYGLKSYVVEGKSNRVILGLKEEEEEEEEEEEK